MPMTRYEIRNEYSLADPDLYRTADKDDPEALLEGVAMAGLVGVLRQLGDLAEFAADIFHCLHEEVMATAARGHGLMSRVQQLETEVPSIEKAFLSQTVHSSFFYHAGLDWHPNLQVDQNIITQGDLPRFIMDSYEECRAPPRLFLLDKFDVAGAGACLKRYTDPSFFKVETSGVTGLDVPREKKIRKGKKKGPRWRNGENPDVLPTSHTKLHQLFLEERVENGVSTPSHRAKLKRRLNGFPFAAKTEKSYMEKILNSTSPDHKLLHEVNANSSLLMLATDDSNKSGLEFRSVNPERESDGEKRSAPSSPDGEKIMLKHTKCEQREIPILAGDGEKIISVDAESSREGSIIGYQSDCISSEVDNYVDAPSTIVSEMDTDRDFKVKSCFTSSIIKDQPLISEANEEDRHTRSSDAQSSTISDVGNNSSRKEISNFSSSDSPSTNQESENFSSKCSPLGDNPEVETIGGLSYKKTDDEDFSVDQHSKLDSRVEEKDMLNRPVWDEQVDEPKSDIRCHSRDSSVAMSLDLLEDRSDRDDRDPAENFPFEITNSTPEMISSGNLIPDKLDDESPMLPENLDELDCEDSVVSINDPDLIPCNMEDSLGTKPDNTSSVNAQTVHAEDNHSNSSMENQFINSPQEDGTFPLETFHSCEVEDLQGTCLTDSEALESSCSAVECVEEPAGTSDTEISVPADLKSINEVRVVLDESESEADKSNTKVEDDENHLSESQQEEGQTKASTSENSFCNTVGHPESEVSDSLPNSHLDLEVESVHAASGLKTEDKIFQEMDSGNNDSEFEFVQVASGFETVEKIFQESDSGNHFSEVEFVQAVAGGLEAGDRLLQENDSGNHDSEVEFAQASSGLETEDKIFRESDTGNHDSEVEFVQAASGLETEDKNVQESDSGNHDSEFEFIQASSGLEAEDKNFRESDSGNHDSEVEFVQAASGLEAEVKIFLDSDSGNHVSDAPPSRHVDYDSEQSLVKENISLRPSQIGHDEGDSDSNSTFSFIHCESPHSINDPLNSIFPPTNQINLAELAPLPPLPPVQWRMGKSTPSNDEEVKSLLEETKQSPIQIAHGPTSKEEKVDNNETILETNFVPETIEPSPVIENKQPVSENEITATSEEDGVANGSQMMKLPRPRNPLVEDVAALDKSKLRKVTERIRPQIQKVDERDSLLEQIRTKSFNLRPAMASRPSIRGPNTNLNVAAILEKANAIRQAFVGSDEDDDDSWSDS